MPVKIGLSSDWHLGVFTHSYTTKGGVPSRTVDAYDGVKRQLEVFKRERCDTIVVAGDLFHYKNPKPIYIQMAAELLHMASKQANQVIVICGNHDPMNKGGAGPISLLKSMTPPNVYCYEGEENVDFDYKENICLNIRPYHRKVTSLLPVKNPSKTNIMIAHHHFSGAIHGSEEFLLAGGVGVSQQTFGADIILSGHIHKPQIIRSNNNKKILYPGSTARLDFGERNDKRGCWVVDVYGKDDIRETFHEIECRNMVEIVIEEKWLKKKNHMCFKDLEDWGVPNSDVKVKIKCKNKATADIKRLKTLINYVKPYYCTEPVLIVTDNPTKTRQQELGVIEGQDPLIIKQTYANLWIDANVNPEKYDLESIKEKVGKIIRKLC